MNTIIIYDGIKYCIHIVVPELSELIYFTPLTLLAKVKIYHSGLWNESEKEKIRHIWILYEVRS